MIKMVDKQTIIHLHRVNNLSQREISRKLGICRKTVRKVLKEYQCAIESDSDASAALERVLTTPPRYSSSKRLRPVLSKEITDMIDDCLSRNRIKRSSGMKKQCMQGKDIHAELAKKGLNISYSSVCKYIASKRSKPASSEAFIRQEYESGQICEFDWAETKLYIAGKLTRMRMAVFTLCSSNGRHSYLFRREDTLAFMESHRNFFRDVKGVPAIIVYDNMRVAISKFAGREKKPTSALLRMSTFYGYQFRYTNIRRGNEKGHVERSVEFIRRKAFCTKDSFSSIEEAQEHLSVVCEKINKEPHSSSTRDIAELYPRDIAALTPFSDEMGCFELREFKIDKWSTFCFNTSHYSVPDRYVGKMVAVKIFSEKLQVIEEGKVVREHERIYESGWRINYDDYLNTLIVKPGALAGSTALKQAPDIVKEIFRDNFTDNASEFVSLLFYMREHGFSVEDMERAYRKLKINVTRQVSADQIKVILHGLNDDTASDIAKSDEGKQIEQNAIKTLLQLTECMNQPYKTNRIYGQDI